MLGDNNCCGKITAAAAAAKRTAVDIDNNSKWTSEDRR